MLATSNAVFVGRRSYEKKDKETEKVTVKHIYDFLVFDSEEVNGLRNARLMSMCLNDAVCDVAESLYPLTRCVVDLDVKVFASGTYMTIVDVQEV